MRTHRAALTACPAVGAASADSPQRATGEVSDPAGTITADVCACAQEASGPGPDEESEAR